MAVVYTRRAIEARARPARPGSSTLRRVRLERIDARVAARADGLVGAVLTRDLVRRRASAGRRAGGCRRPTSTRCAADAGGDPRRRASRCSSSSPATSTRTTPRCGWRRPSAAPALDGPRPGPEPGRPARRRTAASLHVRTARAGAAEPARPARGVHRVSTARSSRPATSSRASRSRRTSSTRRRSRPASGSRATARRPLVRVAPFRPMRVAVVVKESLRAVGPASGSRRASGPRSRASARRSSSIAYVATTDADVARGARGAPRAAAAGSTSC